MGDLHALGIDAGPCGAAALAGAREVLTGPGANERRETMGLPPEETVLLVSTDGSASVGG